MELYLGPYATASALIVASVGVFSQIFLLPQMLRQLLLLQHLKMRSRPANPPFIECWKGRKDYCLKLQSLCLSAEKVKIEDLTGMLKMLDQEEIKVNNLEVMSESLGEGESVIDYILPKTATYHF